MIISETLERIGELLEHLDAAAVSQILQILGGHTPAVLFGDGVSRGERGAHNLGFLEELRLYSDFLPRAHDHPFTEEQRYLHYLWDAIDRLPCGLCVPLAIPFRRMIAKRLFKRCGKNFICEEQVRFNFGQLIDVGNDVFMNRGVFLDSKGGITIGDSAALTEDVKIFTHLHSESVHSQREYRRVVIGPYAKIYTGAVIMPGVTVGEQAIVAAGSLVLRDVPPSTVVAGSPAKEIRPRKTEGRSGAELDHRWLHDGAFQDEV
jgi:acetyltransferase-like isoleucine patch superfamily enzyme